MVNGTLTSRYTFGDYFGVFPLRYAGPFLLAWLLVRRLDRAARSAPWVLFAAAGPVVLNNPEFGARALAATLAALCGPHVIGARGRSAASPAHSAIGLAAAYALVALFTLVRAGGCAARPAVRLGRLYSMAPSGCGRLHRVLGLHLSST